MKDVLISIFGWLLGLFFLLMGIGSIQNYPIAAILLFLAATLSFPLGIRKVREKINISGMWRTIFILLLFFSAAVIASPQQASEAGSSAATSTNYSNLSNTSVLNEEHKNIPIKETNNISQPTVTSSHQIVSSKTERDVESYSIGKNVSENYKLRVGAFNIEIFGQSKASKPEVMDILAKTIRNYDIIGIQEIRDSTQTSLPTLVSEVNSDGSKYDYVVSERLGRTNSKEQYAYIYNTRTIQLEGSPNTYPEPSGTDPFQREPYIATFKSGDFNATYILIHTDPDEATSEINALCDVVKYTENKCPNESDIIIMGDLNADGSYFNENSQNSLSKYHWLIGNSIDTTAGSTKYTYDRIITTDSAYNKFTGDSGVFRFDTIYGLNSDETNAVSDHYPVYAEFSCSGALDNPRKDISSQPISETTSIPEVTPKPTPTPLPVTTSAASSDSSGALYIGNSDSKIYHYASCSSAERISPKNRVEFNSKQEAENAGYTACKRCKP